MKNGIIIADTKLEFGIDSDGVLTLGDEVLTSDSSRFWPADEWTPGRTQHAFDKQYVRDWSMTTGWDQTPPGPAMPPEVVEATRQRYVEVYERITGNKWDERRPCDGGKAALLIQAPDRRCHWPAQGEGLEPQRDHELRWDRSIGASRLLRGLGIADLEDHQGAMDPDNSLNYVRRVHGD